MGTDHCVLVSCKNIFLKTLLNLHPVKSDIPQSSVFTLFKYFLISLIISSVTHELFRIVLFNFQILGYLQISFQFNSMVMRDDILYYFKPFKLLRHFLRLRIMSLHECLMCTGKEYSVVGHVS